MRFETSLTYIHVQILCILYYTVVRGTLVYIDLSMKRVLAKRLLLLRTSLLVR